MRLLAVCVALVCVAPALAAEALDRREARTVTRTVIEADLAPFLSPPGAAGAHVTIRRCRTRRLAGSCLVMIDGSSVCTARVRVRETEDSYYVWADWMRCR